MVILLILLNEVNAFMLAVHVTPGTSKFRPFQPSELNLHFFQLSPRYAHFGGLPGSIQLYCKARMQ